MMFLSTTGFRTRCVARVFGAACVAMFGVVGVSGLAHAQAPDAVTVAPLTPTVAPLEPAVGEFPVGSPSRVTPAGCTSCGTTGLSGLGGWTGTVAPLESPGICGGGSSLDCGLGCGDPGCGEAGCVAGRQPCETYTGNRCGRIFHAFRNALCCPDPCYEPRWVPAANAALFTPSVRPSTYTRFRWDYGNNVTTPDRAEYFFAQVGGKGPAGPVRRVDYDELSLYAEIGTQKFAFFVDTPYRAVDIYPTNAGRIGAASFGDLTVGTKSALLDSELILSSFQFATTIPVGVPSKGTGVGHVSLEPSLLTAMKLYPDLYWQSQIAYWIPISASTVGGSNFSGGVFRFNNALNYVVWRPVSDTQLIGTIESNGWTFTAGRFTDAQGNIRRGNRATYFTMGPGLRLSICDKIDFGFGMQFALTSHHFADQLYRTEFRWRF